MASPITDPVAAGQQHDDDLQATIAALVAPNPHWQEMNLPASMTDDGAN